MYLQDENLKDKLRQQAHGEDMWAEYKRLEGSERRPKLLPKSSKAKCKMRLFWEQSVSPIDRSWHSRIIFHTSITA